MSENKLNVIDLHKRYGEHEVLKGGVTASECRRCNKHHRIVGIGEKYLSALH